MIIEFEKRTRELEALIHNTIDEMGELFGRLREFEARLKEVRELKEFYKEEWVTKKVIKDA